MDKKLNLNEKLDFNDIDLTEPKKVIEEILSQLPEETKGIVLGKIVPYDGYVTSYQKPGLASISLALGTMAADVDIQSDLGEFGLETYKYECFIYTPRYDKYKYRMFFIKHGISNYPVDIILEESIARSISLGSEYVFTCSTRTELEDLIVSILTSKRIISVMQEIIRINQANRNDEIAKADSTGDEE